MRFRLAAIGLAIGGLLAAPSSAVGSHDPSGTPFDEDFVVGNAAFASGSPIPGDNTQLNLDAHSGPAGQNPTGLAAISLRQSFLGGPITCLHVEGNRAVIAGGGPTVPAPFLFVVEDNAATGQPDLFGSVPIPFDEPPLTNCSIEVPDPNTPIIAGDIVVHDAAATTPTDKSECKNGGWRNYGTTFKNQGDCLSFVATSAKKQP
jgi:hypothetical protein